MSERLENDKDDVLDILSNSFEPGEEVVVRITRPAKIVGYYRDGFYEIVFHDGLFADEMVLYHHSDLKRPSGAERNTRIRD